MKGSKNLSAQSEASLTDDMLIGKEVSTPVEIDVKIISEDKGDVQVISARELHEKLKSSERFSKWWERFASYGFVENEDFVVCTKKYAANQHGGEKEFDDYSISIEMAKQICMLQRTDLGRQCREYFLKVEKAWNTPEAVMARALKVANRTLENIRQRVCIAESALNRIANGKGCYSMNQAAKALKLPYGNIKLYERLRNEGVLNLDNSPKQEQINSGHFKVVVKYINDKIGNKPVTLVTGKGLVYLAKRFNMEIDESALNEELGGPDGFQ